MTTTKTRAQQTANGATAGCCSDAAVPTSHQRNLTIRIPQRIPECTMEIVLCGAAGKWNDKCEITDVPVPACYE